MWIEKGRDLATCAAIILLFWAPLGRYLASRLIRHRGTAGMAVATALGIGAWGMWILLMGVLGVLFRSAVLISILVLFLVLGLYRQLVSADSKPRDFSETSSRFAPAIMALIGLGYLVLVAASSLAPEVGFDSLNVHLPYARDAALSHRIAFDPNNWSSTMPALPLMSYITAFLFAGVNLAKLFNVVCFAVCAGVTYHFTRRWWDTRVAVAAAMLFLSCPVALYEATTALIDLPLTMFSAMAVLALLEWTRSDDPGALRLSAVSLGFAMGCKYHSAFWLAPVFLIILSHSLFERRQSLKQCSAELARYFLIVLALFLPWIVRAWLYSGNPIFPAANWLFKSPYFTPQMEAAATAVYANQRAGFSLLEWLRLPWTVTFHPAQFHGTLGFIFLPGLALALIRRPGRPVAYGFLAAGCYFAAWSLSAQEIRYLLPVAPLLAFLTAAGFIGSWKASAAPAGEASGALSWPRRAAEYGGVVVLIAGALLAIPPVYQSVIKDWTYWHSYQSPLAYLSGRQSAQDFVRRDVPSIYVYDYINSHLDRRNRILLLNDASRFYSNVPTLYSFTVEAERILLRDTEEGVVAGLAESGISHVLLNYNGIAPVPGVAPRLGVYFFLDRRFQERYLEPVYANNNVVLYRVRSGAGKS